MYAKTLGRILGLLCQNSDVSHNTPRELDQRLKSLRGYGRLPRGRERRDEKLSNTHIAAAVFGLVPTHPGWAGHVEIILEGPRPVGGTEASFFLTSTLSDVVVVLLTDEEARKSFIRMTLTMAETGMNSRGGAEIVYLRDGQKRRAYFVPKEGVSLLSSGRDFDPDRDRMNAPAMREMSFTKEFFQRLARECELAERFPAPPKATAQNAMPRKPSRNVIVGSACAMARAFSMSASITKSPVPRKNGSSRSTGISWSSCPRPRITCNPFTSI